MFLRFSGVNISEYDISIDGVLDSETKELRNKKDLGQFQQSEFLFHRCNSEKNSKMLDRNLSSLPNFSFLRSPVVMCDFRTSCAIAKARQ